MGAVFGQPDKKSFTPKEIVQNTCKLPGVAGAVIATLDGMLVDSQLPVELKGETLAGFLPQIFARINQYTKEMNIGELDGLTLQVNNTPWLIYKAGTVFFTVLGQSRGSLPSEKLHVVAEELGRQGGK
jgi:predicted regulator of Ras-like GTPase activity (Roadblock/LC7/MglB family)